MVKSKVLMIPFSYYHNEMLDYVDYTYREGGENSNKIWWDTEDNRRISDPICPRKPSDTYSDKEYYWFGGRERWAADVADYPERRSKFEQEQAEFTDRVHSRRYLLVDAIVWKENYEFEDSLKLTSMSRGRSAANFNLRSETDGRNYNLFMTDTVDLIQNCEIKNGVIKGKWTFVKRGANYGIRPVLTKGVE
jgi:hypothetical protein